MGMLNYFAFVAPILSVQKSICSVEMRILCWPIPSLCSQRSIEALKLKNSVEKATLNDMHMNTIKVFVAATPPSVCKQLYVKFVSYFTVYANPST